MAPSQNRQSRVFRFLLALPVPWVFVLGYLAGAELETLLIPGKIVPRSALLEIVGLVLFVIGAVIAGWAWTIFHRKGTTRVPGEASIALVTSGPYRVTRNPMYVGLTIAYIGEAAIQAQVLPLVMLVLVVVYVNGIVIPLEESRLREVFGPAYDTYRGEVRRWLGTRSH